MGLFVHKSSNRLDRWAAIKISGECSVRIIPHVLKRSLCVIFFPQAPVVWRVAPTKCAPLTIPQTVNLLSRTRSDGHFDLSVSERLSLCANSRILLLLAMFSILWCLREMAAADVQQRSHTYSFDRKKRPLVLLGMREFVEIDFKLCKRSIVIPGSFWNNFEFTAPGWNAQFGRMLLTCSNIPIRSKKFLLNLTEDWYFKLWITTIKAIMTGKLSVPLFIWTRLIANGLFFWRQIHEISITRIDNGDHLNHWSCDKPKIRLLSETCSRIAGSVIASRIGRVKSQKIFIFRELYLISSFSTWISTSSFRVIFFLPPLNMQCNWIRFPIIRSLLDTKSYFSVKLKSQPHLNRALQLRLVMAKWIQKACCF